MIGALIVGVPYVTKPPCPAVAVTPTALMRSVLLPVAAMLLFVRIANAVRLALNVCDEVKSLTLVPVAVLTSVFSAPEYGTKPFVASLWRKNGVPFWLPITTGETMPLMTDEARATPSKLTGVTRTPLAAFDPSVNPVPTSITSVPWVFACWEIASKSKDD